MSTFKDSTGREWFIKVVVDAIERIREIGIDLGDITGATMRRLLADDVLLVRTLWLLCEAQADRDGITPAQFGEAMLGDALDDGYEALRGSLDDFFPRRKRDYWRRMLAVEQEAQAEAMEVGLAALDDPVNKAEMSLALKERVREEIHKALKSLKSATDSPDSSE